MEANDNMVVWEYLGELGWHADGAIKRGRQTLGYYYKCDTLTDAQLERLRHWWPWAVRYKARSQYAPEQVSPVVFVPCKAERARLAKAERDSAPDFYRLPPEYSWADVARGRFLWDIKPGRYPLASGPGATAWGVPMAVDFAQIPLAYA